MGVTNGKAGHELGRLLARGVEHGQKDAFAGKRDWPRYRIGMRLEGKTDTSSQSQPMALRMHDISGGGFGCWSKEPLEDGTQLYVREWSADPSSEWVPARVRHCTLGLGGYLIGAAVDDPLPVQSTQAAGEANSTDAGSTADGPRPRERNSRRSLRAKCALVAATAGALGATLATQLFSATTTGAWTGWQPFAGILIAVITSGGFAWLLMGDEVRFLRVLRAQLRRMATGALDPPEIGPAPSAELAAARQAVAELASGWDKHKRAESEHRTKLEELNLLKSNILSMVSHDLRTPLTSILLYAEMLREELVTLDEADQQHFLQIICDECTRLSHLVDDLLEVQRIESGRFQWQMTRLDLSRIVRACTLVFDPMAKSKGIELRTDCPESLPAVEADADKIAQVLSNLVSNAIKYTPAGGFAHVSAEARGREVLICVADNGPGIERDKWDHIFERFSQVCVSLVREISGVGLGLYIVRQIVERHGGRVWVDSEIGRGTKFYVALPIQSDSPGETQPEEASAPAGRVVVCDADPELANRVAQVIRRQNLEVRLAYSGCRLLAHLDQTNVDVVVTDVLLPDMNASDLLDSLTSIENRQFVIVAHTHTHDGSELRRRGVDIFVQRPATEDELRQAVQLALKKRSKALTVALVAGDGAEHRDLLRLVSERGDMPLATPTLASAADLIRNNPIDLVIVAADC